MPESPEQSLRTRLEVGRTYTSEELSVVFGFHPYYLRTAGGMVAVPSLNSLLLITHGGDDASFEYGDYWDGEDLIYTGRGQDGDQVLKGANRDVAENRRVLWLFEHRDKYERRFLGAVSCVGHWWAVAPDKNGAARRVLRFRLHPDEGSLRPDPGTSSARRQVRRRARPFDEARVPTPPSAGESSLTPEELAQLLEKASAQHHALLVALKRRLETEAWTHVEEIPSAVDLWARRGDVRVIFEAKTLTAGKEITQVRAALAQLLEYRFFYGQSSDLLCLVTDCYISDARLRFLDAMNVLVLCLDGASLSCCGTRAQSVFGWPAPTSA